MLFGISISRGFSFGVFVSLSLLLIRDMKKDPKRVFIEELVDGFAGSFIGVVKTKSLSFVSYSGYS